MPPGHAPRVYHVTGDEERGGSLLVVSLTPVVTEVRGWVARLDESGFLRGFRVGGRRVPVNKKPGGETPGLGNAMN